MLLCLKRRLLNIILLVKLYSTLYLLVQHSSCFPHCIRYEKPRNKQIAIPHITHI